ncbi:MAG TPA: hypothetical protein VFM46_19290 [Pseudomonadales bacterium]|nr:hypothetical protein [Pseudomonadales bacterium]
MSDKSHVHVRSAMKQLLFALLLVVPLLSCQTPTPAPLQDDPALRHQILQDAQNFSFDAAKANLQQYQQRFPASTELPALKAAVAERYLDHFWMRLAKAGVNAQSDSNLHGELIQDWNEAHALGATPAHLNDAKSALESRVESKPVNSTPEKNAVAEKSQNNGVKSTANNSTKANKKTKAKAEKVSETAPDGAVAVVEAPAKAEPVEAVEKASDIPTRREIRLNPADVEARSDVVSGMLKQIAKHIVKEPVNVVIQSRSMKDFRWINALLKTSIQELDPQFNLSSEPVVDPSAAPAVILMAR